MTQYHIDIDRQDQGAFDRALSILGVSNANPVTTQSTEYGYSHSYIITLSKYEILYLELSVKLEKIAMDRLYG